MTHNFISAAIHKERVYLKREERKENKATNLDTAMCDVARTDTGARNHKLRTRVFWLIVSQESGRLGFPTLWTPRKHSQLILNNCPDSSINFSPCDLHAHRIRLAASLPCASIPSIFNLEGPCIFNVNCHSNLNTQFNVPSSVKPPRCLQGAGLVSMLLISLSHSLESITQWWTSGALVTECAGPNLALTLVVWLGHNFKFLYASIF